MFFLRRDVSDIFRLDGERQEMVKRPLLVEVVRRIQRLAAPFFLLKRWLGGIRLTAGLDFETAGLITDDGLDEAKRSDPLLTQRVETAND